jgi:two-component system cell cycle sensor histidine kinase/response regulator CckA
MTSELSRRIIGALPDAVVSIDRTSIVISVNDAACRIFGYAAEEFVGRPLAETIIPTELAPQHGRGMDKFLSTGHGPVIGRHIEIVARDKTGRRFPIELCVFLDPEQPREVFHATIRDISARAARDAANAAERAQVQLFFDATADVWWDCRIGGETRFSERAASELGLADGVLGPVPTPDQPWIAHTDRARMREAWDEHLRGASGRYECTYRVETNEGKERWFRDRGRAVEFDAGRPIRIVGSTTDVTEQREAEDRLRNAQRLELLGVLAGGFAHDLNNLLAAIRGQAALAATEHGVAPAVLESLEAIQLATTKAKVLASNMLSLGKPQASEIRRFPARPAIEESVQLVRPGLPRSIAISVDLSGTDGLDLEMDPSAFQQAILNLVINARDAMPQGGTLRIEGSSRADASGNLELLLLVEDTGVGMTTEVRKRLFEPFFTTKPKGVGTGLGLAVVHQAVVGGKGSIDVSSEPGRGTRFTLALPAFESAEAMQASNAIEPLEIVVGEEHGMLRPMLAEALRACGHTVYEAADGALALRLASERASPPGLLVLDAQLSHVDGFRVHARAEERFGGRVPVVFTSSDGSTVMPSPSSPHVTMLAKPFEIHELLDAVARVTRGRDRSR